jgi:hypothetical protein
MNQFKKIIESVDCASRRTFSKFIYYLPEYISKSFRKEDIQCGWLKCGLYPLDVVKILKFWPQFDIIFKNISEQDGTLKRLLDSIQFLSTIGFEKGFVSDEDIIQSTKDILPTAATNEVFEFENYTFNRWRAAWMNNAGTLARRIKWKKDKDDVIQEALKKKKQKQEKKEAKNSSKKIKILNK